MARIPRAISGMVCIKCGQDRVEPQNVPLHGVKRCTRVANRERECPLCGMEFAHYSSREMDVTDFSKTDATGAHPRKKGSFFVRKAWPAKMIYAHKADHLRRGDTPENYGKERS